MNRHKRKNSSFDFQNSWVRKIWTKKSIFEDLQYRGFSSTILLASIHNSQETHLGLIKYFNSKKKVLKVNFGQFD